MLVFLYVIYFHVGRVIRNSRMFEEIKIPAYTDLLVWGYSPKTKQPIYLGKLFRLKWVDGRLSPSGSQWWFVRNYTLVEWNIFNTVLYFVKIYELSYWTFISLLNTPNIIISHDNSILIVCTNTNITRTNFNITRMQLHTFNLKIACKQYLINVHVKLFRPSVSGTCTFFFIFLFPNPSMTFVMESLLKWGISRSHLTTC